MRIYPIKTNRFSPEERGNILSVIDSYVTALPEKSIVAVTSKLVAILQGRVVKKNQINKNKLIEKEADLFIPPEKTGHDFYLTIKNDVLIPSSGIDESNAGDFYVLWPEDLQKVANSIRLFLLKKFKLKQVGVLITDSTTSPLRWGVRGIALSHSGFAALNDYVGKPDIFGRKLAVTKVNVADALASGAVLTMGEGSEQTPLALITEIPFVKFQPRNPNQKELSGLKISLDEDIFAPILKAAPWQSAKK